MRYIEKAYVTNTILLILLTSWFVWHWTPKDVAAQAQGESPAPNSRSGSTWAAAAIAAVALMAQNSPLPASKQSAAALPTLKSLKGTKPSENFVLKSIREGRVADLRSSTSRHLGADFLSTLIFRTAASAVPNKLVSIRGATIDGAISVPDGSSPVPNNLVFTDCTFTETVAFSTGRFDQSLVFTNSHFKRGLLLTSAKIKGDFVISGGAAEPMGDLPGLGEGSVADSVRASSIVLSQSEIDGQLIVSNVNAGIVAGERLKADSVLVTLDKTPIDELLLPLIETGALTIVGAAPHSPSTIENLDLEQANVKGELWLQNVKIKELSAASLHVGGITALDPNVAITDSLNLSDSQLGQFSWAMPGTPIRWPNAIIGSGLTFTDLKISDKPDNPTAEDRDSELNMDLLTRADAAESAFVAYESLLRGRGRLSESDHVYSEMRKKRRIENWRKSNCNDCGIWRRIGAVVFGALDLGEDIFFGYGRFPLTPLAWSIAFFVLGLVVFWDSGAIERTDDKVDFRSFSTFWYSLELFLLVVDLGVAKNWRPKQEHPRVKNYARVHQLAGWLFIPAALAAMTGAIK